MFANAYTLIKTRKEPFSTVSLSCLVLPECQLIREASSNARQVDTTIHTR